ncbi:PEP-CTERM sorting domain-containing protein [Crocosphaera sp.]|uniref:PEP-CTERM sorting domain-containing protein n=1 Tax=Crocosphaera sp. TaxID=2729996 RepID=UPI003F204A39
MTIPLDALALNFKKTYVFGSSNSSMGNIFNVTTDINELPPQFIPEGFPGPTPASPPYFEGRFSNGPVWVEYLTQDLGIDLKTSTSLSVSFPGSTEPSAITQNANGELIVSPFYNGATGTNSVNFAFGGATTGSSGIGAFGPLIPGVQTQVSHLINDLGTNSIKKKDLIILFAGTNDLRSNPNVDTSASVNNLTDAITRLYDQGARNFLVANSPDLSQEPGIPDDEAFMNNLVSNINQFNSSLDSSLNGLNQSLNDINITSLDLYGFLNEVRDNPEEYGYTNLDQACFDQVNFSICSQEEQAEYFYWDNIHWTSKTHELIGDFALENLQQTHEPVPEPLTILGAGTAVAFGTTFKRKLAKSKKK